MVQYIANSLLEVFQMDLSYFRQVAPVTDDILSIVIAVGWALLLGNLVFQAMKSMVIGLGFEGEDPKLLFTRTFVFAFLLLVSQQICEIGLGISSQVIALLQVPTSVTITIPDENNFTIGASWLLIIIVGIVVMWQFVKLCFEVAERYVVTAILVLMAPLAFGMGGSKNTEDIFKGWCRMFGSMCGMMIMTFIIIITHIEPEVRLSVRDDDYECHIPEAADFGFGVCAKRGCRPALDASDRRYRQGCPQDRRHHRPHGA